MGAVVKATRQTPGMIRCVAAVFHAKGSDAFVPSVRVCDPDLATEDGEFFTVEVKHLDGLIAAMRKAATDAQARADQLTGATPEDRALLVTEAEGRA